MNTAFIWQRNNRVHAYSMGKFDGRFQVAQASQAVCLPHKSHVLQIDSDCLRRK